MLSIQKAIHEDNVIGIPQVLYSDFTLDAYGKIPETHRLLDPTLAGGGLLDLGPYPLVWVCDHGQHDIDRVLTLQTMMILYRHPQNGMSAPDRIGSTMLLSDKGVDLTTGFNMTFPKLKAIANCEWLR
jgi:dihydrodiol dehydrogenase / D-xylose 1-dehydrogenase (NADP)